MHILKNVFIILEVLLLFNLLIFVHELGHFLAARWRGLKVERFAIWFGKPIWKKTINGVEYALGSIPAGGYVSLPQMATMEAIEGKSETPVEQLPPVSALDKIIVAVAGPLFSFLLAVAFASVVWIVGRPVNEGDKTTTLGWVEPQGPAWKAGLRPGDKILEIDGHPVTQFSSQSEDSITWRIITSEGTNIAIKYVRDGKEDIAYPAPTRPATKWYERKSLRKLLISPEQESIVYEVFTNSPAAVAGLKRGDKITQLNGEKVYSPMAIMSLEESMTNAANIKPVSIKVKRDSEEFEKTLAAEKPLQPKESKPSLGIESWQANTNSSLAHPNPLEQIDASVTQIFGTLRTLFSRKSDIGAQQLGGAIMIIRVYSNLFDSENGWRLVLWFSVIMNVNLALLNMLPFPVLDGGHITLSLLEIVRRRPVSAKLLQYIQTACAVALIGFMLYIAFFDAGDWARSAGKDRNVPVVFAPKN
ncbi:MAG: regulator of sigma protease [Verrucomicrobiales bacterium]|nr:regulator of sigma protease [Verrucomicrobiales bacterium]